MTTLNKNALAAKYLELRNEVASIEAAAKEKTGPLKELMGKIETYFKGLASVEGVNSWNTDSGTVYLSHLDSARIVDSAAFMDFVTETESWDLIEKRASKTAVRQFLTANNTLPPGVDLTTRIEVNVRQPSK